MKKFLGTATAVIIMGSASVAAADTFVRMVSGPSGGSWYPLGAKIMSVMQEEIDGIATSNTSGGGISNVLSVDGGDAEIGWTYGHTVANGYYGKGKFDSEKKNVRYFATLYPSYFQIAVPEGSEIQSFADMKGKNISPGKAKWTGTAFAESILQAYGMDFNSIKAEGGIVHNVSYSESVALMKDENIDVFMAVTSMPQASFLELEASPGIRFIDIPDAKVSEILEANPGFLSGKMTSEHYASVKEPINVLSTNAVMVVSADLDDETVYKMCKTFWANHAKFAEVKKIWNRVKLEDALKGAAIPVHPGAQKCYDELGVKG